MQFKKNILLLICFASLALAQAGKSKGAPAGAEKKTSAPAPAASGPISIPKDAVEIEPGLFQANDAATGKTWHYTRTPFGVRRFEPQVREDTTVEEAARLKVTAQDGESVSFERKTPWNSARWTKKRDKLNAAEKLAVERAARPASDTGATATAKPAAKQ